MSKKEEALEHIKEIKSVLADSSKFVPYDGNIFFVWAFVGGIMLYFGPDMFYKSTLIGVIFLVVGFLIGFSIEGYLVKKVNKLHDIELYTPIQKNIEYAYAIMAVFAIVLTAIFFLAGVKGLIYPTWIFAIGFPGFLGGLAVKCKIFTTVSAITTGIALLMFLHLAFNIQMINSDNLVEIGKYISILVLVPSYIYLGFDMKRTHV